jgi:Holliday junction resolvase
MSPRNAHQNRGIQRERDLVNQLRKEGWIAFRAPGSLGFADVIAMKNGEIMFIESKSNAESPYAKFGPEKRARLLEAARIAGATAWLVNWPKNKKQNWIHSDEWPKPREQ